MVILIAFWNPLQQTAKLLPDLIKDTDQLTVGGFTLTVRSALADRIPRKVRDILPNLSAEALEYILTSEGQTYIYDSAELGSAEKELISSDLCKPMSKAALAASSKESSQEDKKLRVFQDGFECGDLYSDTRKFLRELIPELARQAIPKEKRGTKAK